MNLLKGDWSDVTPRVPSVQDTGGTGEHRGRVYGTAKPKGPTNGRKAMPITRVALRFRRGRSTGRGPKTPDPHRVEQKGHTACT